jgi:hypothetical protein
VLKGGGPAPVAEAPDPRGLRMQIPPTPLTDWLHIDRVEKLQSRDEPSEYYAQ